ncbi:Peroxiredoxin OsmC [bioreactor metagenome]|jgi:osmotically inducible protein OsmC|uniref:Peroxiredoxin OsmC n=1 Tax=bioreactor metagenome TaxID=1076179 RepID=A0A645HX32_9ZZZZ
MADIERHAQARWTGALREGSGTTTTGSGIINQAPYSVPSRFESGKGTNPEELLAAAHASCFSMMLAKIMGDRQKVAREISTRATVTMSQRNGTPRIIKIHLDTEVEADGLNETTLKEVAAQAKEQCPVSILLRPGLEEITLSARLRTA